MKTVNTLEFKLKERVKELNCLYSISKIFNKISTDGNNNIGFILKKIISIIPYGYQIPEKTIVKILFDKKEYYNNDIIIKTRKYFQREKIIIKNNVRGYIEVFYNGNSQGNPFLREERKLIKAVCVEISQMIERIEQNNERRIIEQQLVHSDRLATLGTLAAGIAHELTEPIGSILGFAQLTLKHENITKEAKEDVNKIINSALHGREIIRKLLFFSRQDKQKKINVNINNSIMNDFNFLESRCEKEGIEIIKELDHKIPEIKIDPIHVNQIIVNLMVNSIQAMPHGGKLNITTKLRKDEICLSIRDTGVGIKRDIMSKIFEPFFTTKKETGTGLGLSVINNIIKSYNGKINVRSKVNNGTVFEITLPICCNI